MPQKLETKVCVHVWWGHFCNVKICVHVCRAHVRNDLEAVSKYLSLVVDYVFLNLVQYQICDLGFRNK